MTYDQLLQAIREVQSSARVRIEAAVEAEKVREAWETGKLIDEHILQHKERAQYGERVLQRLSLDLGTSKRELHYMVEFARAYPIVPVPAQLSWSHYRELLAVNDEKERRELAEQAVKENWNQMRTREEIQRRQHRSQAPEKFPPITPGPLYTYQIIRLKNRLKIDLGFGLYLDLSQKDAKKFKEGDIIQSLRARPNPDRKPGTGESGTGPNIAGTCPWLEDLSLYVVEATPPPLRGGGVISNLYTYSALATQVVDGDTFHALIDLGFGLTLAQRVRLRRIDAPEILTADGKEAKASLEKILSRDQGRILMKSADIDQHGRPIADVWVKDKPVDQELLDQGLAVRISE